MQSVRETSFPGHLPFTSMYEVVWSELRATFKKTSQRKLEQCSRDLCFVALSIRYDSNIHVCPRSSFKMPSSLTLGLDRTGYLFDAFTTGDRQKTALQIFSDVLVALRKVSIFFAITSDKDTRHHGTILSYCSLQVRAGRIAYMARIL